MQTLVIKRTKILSKSLLAVLGFSLLMVLSSFVKVPLAFSPVPLTFQTLVVFLSIVCLKSRASVSQGVYIALGLIGIPVFSSGGAGFLYLLGPTGGYIVGFFVSALVGSRLFSLIEKSEKVSLLKLVCLFSFVTAIIYLFGVLGLMVNLRFSLKGAISSGVFPFLTLDAFKVILAAQVAYKIIKK